MLHPFVVFEKSEPEFIVGPQDWTPPDRIEPVEPECWEQVVILEPDLLLIEADAKRRRKSIRSANRWRVYEEFKQRFGRYVGWGARMPILGSSRIYDIAHSRIVSALGV